IFRIMSYVVLPGVDTDALTTNNPIAGILDLFAGGAFSRASIAALGIMPYITASIIMQLLGIAVPSIQKLQKEGESGRKKITNYTRMLTIIICAFQAPGYIYMMGAQAHPDTTWWFVSTIVILITGSMFAMWLGER